MRGNKHGPEAIKPDPLALRLLEVAVTAGWKPHECLEFAREAYRFLTSTRPEVAVAQSVRPAADPSAKPTPHLKPSSGRVSCPEWNGDLEVRRKALQTLADRNLMMKEAAELLGVSLATVASTAHRLEIRFHGRRGRGRSRPAQGKIKATAENEFLAPALLAPVDAGLKRRCPACNKVFRPTELHHVLCDDCENKQYAARPLDRPEILMPRHSSR